MRRRIHRIHGGRFEFTTLHVSEERHAFLLRLSDALRPLNDPLDMQEAAARLLGEHLQVNRVGYAELNDYKSTIRREYVRGVAPLAGQGLQDAFGPVLREAFRRGETVVVRDVGTDPRVSEAERTILRDRQIAAFVGVMLLKGGRLVAAFGANTATPRDWTSREVELIRDIASAPGKPSNAPAPRRRSAGARSAWHFSSSSPTRSGH